MRGDKRCLWSSGTDGLPGLMDSRRGDEWTSQAALSASTSICMSVFFLAVSLPGSRAAERRARLLPRESDNPSLFLI